jgi:hypothetical protein
MSSVTPKSLLLDGLVLATGIVVSSTVVAIIDNAFPKHKNDVLVKIASAGTLVFCTALAARTVLRESETRRTRK